MDKEEKKRLKAHFKKTEEVALRASIPMRIEDLTELLCYLNRESAPECEHTLKETITYIESHHLDKNKILSYTH